MQTANHILALAAFHFSTDFVASADFVTSADFAASANL